MKKIVLSSILLLFASSAYSAEITPENLVGKYKVKARVAFQTYYATLRVLDTKEFEIQRTYPDGRGDEVCGGTFVLAQGFIPDLAEISATKVFKGKATCPSDRSRTLDFNVDFRNATTESLDAGTNVTLTSSVSPGTRLSAYIKRLH